MMHPETLLVFIKYRKNLTTESEKECKFPVVTIEAIIIGEDLCVQKGMKYVVSLLYRCRYIMVFVRV